MIREVKSVEHFANCEYLRLVCGHSVTKTKEEVRELQEIAACRREPVYLNCETCSAIARGYFIAKEMEPIPISAAKRIAEEYGYDQVVIYARRVGENGGEHLTTYGKDKTHCEVSARMAETLKKFMGWNA